MPPTHREQLALVAEQEAGIRTIIASCRASLLEVEDKDSPAADTWRQLIAMNENLLAQVQALWSALNSLTDRERDMMDGVGPPPTEEELWGRKPD